MRINRAVLAITMMTTLVWSQTVKLGSLAPVNSPWHETMLTLGEDWSKISDGEIKMKLYELLFVYVQ